MEFETYGTENEEHKEDIVRMETVHDVTSTSKSSRKEATKEFKINLQGRMAAVADFQSDMIEAIQIQPDSTIEDFITKLDSLHAEHSLTPEERAYAEDAFRRYRIVHEEVNRLAENFTTNEYFLNIYSNFPQ